MVPPQNITVNISQDAFLACQAEAYPGNLTYTWFQGSSNVFHLRSFRDGDGTEAAAGSYQQCWGWKGLMWPCKAWIGAHGPAGCMAGVFAHLGAVGMVPAAPLTTTP